MPYRKLRPMPHEKTERNDAIWWMSVEHPEYTVDFIGGQFGISGQRVSVLLKRLRNEAHKAKG